MLQFFKRLFGFEDAPTADDGPKHPDPKLISMKAAEFKAALEADPNAVLLDVRTGAEVSGGMLEGAEHIDYMQLGFKKKVAGLDKSKTYYVYCKLGGRSDLACYTMNKMGFDVRNLKGGKEGWPEEV